LRAKFKKKGQDMARPRKTDIEKRLAGTFRQDRSDGRSVVTPIEGELTRPDDLTGAAVALWDKIVPDLQKSGVACPVDSTMLGDMCRWYSRYVRWAAALDCADPMDDKSKGLLLGAGRCWKSFDDLAARFGMTPGDRQRLRIEKPIEDDIPPLVTFADLA